MMGTAILMFIFGIGIVIAGIVLATGHNDQVLLWKVYEKNPSKEKIKNIGKWTLISSIIPFAISLICFVLCIVFGME